MSKIQENIELQKIFQETDPEEIFKILVRELNKIIEDIALSRIVQVSNRFKPWHYKEGEEILREAN